MIEPARIEHFATEFPSHAYQVAHGEVVHMPGIIEFPFRATTLRVQACNIRNLHHDEATGLWSVDIAKAKSAVKDLSTEILMLQAMGDYGGSHEFIDKYGEMGQDVRDSLARLGDIPIDILPRFAIEMEYDE